MTFSDINLFTLLCASPHTIPQHPAYKDMVGRHVAKVVVESPAPALDKLLVSVAKGSQAKCNRRLGTGVTFSFQGTPKALPDNARNY